MAGSWSAVPPTTSLTLPTGAVDPTPRIVEDGISDTILVYGAGGALVASVAATAGMDGFGNAYPAGISATGGVVSQSIILLYSGTPATGNLIASFANAAGADSFGNNYIAGMTAYDIINDKFANLSGGALLFGDNSSGTPDTTDAGSIVALISALPILQQTLTTTSPKGGAYTDPLVRVDAGGAPGQTTGSTDAPALKLTDSLGTSAADFLISGSAIKTDLVGVPLGWSAPTPGTGWALGPNSGTVQPLEYTKNTLDQLVINGAMHTTSATPAGVAFILPAAYRPKITQRVVGVSNSAGTLTVRYIEVNSNGNVLVVPNLATTTTDVYIYLAVPLGNVA